MQSLQVIKIIKEIEKSTSNGILNNLLQGDMIQVTEEGYSNLIAKSMYDYAIVRQNILNIKDSPTVLEHFNLSNILDHNFILNILNIGLKPVKSIEDEKERQDAYAVARDWRFMVNFANKLEDIVIPKELIEKRDLDSLLTLEIRNKDNETLTINNLNFAIENTIKIYNTLCTIYGIKDIEKLEILKIESGSKTSIVIKGLAKSLKYFKDFITEFLNKIIHAKANKLKAQNDALLDTLSVYKEIKKQEDNNTIDSNTASQFRLYLKDGVTNMYSCKMVLAEVTDFETLDNTKLIEEFTQKQLPPPEPKKLPPPKSKKKSITKKTTNKKTTTKKTSRQKTNK